MAVKDWSGYGVTGYQGNMYCLTNANARWLQQNGYLPTNTLFADDNNCPTVATLNSYANANSYGTSEYAGLGSSNLCPIGYIEGISTVYSDSGYILKGIYGTSGGDTTSTGACTNIPNGNTGNFSFSTLFTLGGVAPVVGSSIKYIVNTVTPPDGWYKIETSTFGAYGTVRAWHVVSGVLTETVDC